VLRVGKEACYNGLQMNVTKRSLRMLWRLGPVLVSATVLCLMQGALAQAVPVIFDTDIGDDIDDTWALVMLVKSPELDLKLVTTSNGKAEYRAKLAARLLTIAKRTDVPVGLGAGGTTGEGGQQAWVQDYSLERYAGTIHRDGVQALIDLIKSSPQPLTIISVGPSHTVAAALEREPGIASKAYFVGMQGSVRKGYEGGPVCAEWNVKANVPAAQKVLLALWKKTTITPLDTCGLVKISGTRFQSLKDSADPLVKALLENYRIWAKKEALTESSVLFDTVAIYLAYPGPKPLLHMEPLTINVNNEGFTTIDPKGIPMAVATSWTDLNGYEDWLVRLILRRTDSGH
jgi:inosine-uridine nucleoside N-ribohydrolase